ncbi:MAG: MFS transporter [Oscillospiraceae bacterium]|nr:MFS transporter [Oscillospiraceae bacterium]
MKTKKKALTFFAVYTLFNMAASFAHPVTPTVIQNLHLPDYMFGLALAVMQTTMFLFSPFWGKITSYISSRVSMCITMIGYGCGQILFAMAKNMRDVLLARLLAGCFTGGAFIASLAYVVNTSPEDLRGRYLTILATIQSVGSAFGYFIGGMLGVKGTQYSFIAQIAVLMASGVLFFFVCESDATKSKEELEMRTLVRECNPFAAFAAGKTFINRTWIKLLGICFMSYIGYNAFEQVFNYYIKDQFNLPSSYNGTIKFAVGIIALIANSTVCMYLIGRTDIRKTTIPVLCLASVFVFATILSPSLILFFVMAVLFFALNSITIPLCQNMCADRARTGDSNLIMGFYQAMRAVGGVIGALLAGFLYGSGPKIPFVFSGAAFALAALCGIAYYSAVRKEEN